MHAQSSTEYIVVFVLIIVGGLFVISILGQFIENGTEADATKTNAYWASKTPIAIIDGSISPNSPYVKFILKNNALEDIEILSIITKSFSSCRDYPVVVCDPSVNISHGGYAVFLLNYKHAKTQMVCTPFCHMQLVYSKNECDSSKYGYYIELNNITIRYKKKGSNVEYFETAKEPFVVSCAPD